MKSLVALLYLSGAPEIDAFNCPEPEGTLAVNEETLYRAFPSHIDRIFTAPLVVDFRCEVDSNGAFSSCIFAARQDVSDSQARILHRMMPRIMLAYSTDVPNQTCVASKISFAFGEAPADLKPPPHKAAR